LTYVAGILSSTTVWAPGTAPLPPKRWSGRGRRPTRLRRGKHKPVSVKELALSLPKRAWRTVGWREVSRDNLDESGASIWMRRSGRVVDDCRWPRDLQAD
jgi:SRSO17 transposase